MYKSFNNSSSKDELLVIKSGESIKIISKYNEKNDLILHFNLLGINEITHLKEVLINNNENDYPSENIESAKIFSRINTDMVSPYGLISQNYVANSKNGFTVGGNHGTDGAGGKRTAQRLELEVILDGKEMNNSSKYGKSLVIRTVNKISPSNNLGGEGIIETVVYKITPCNIEVNVELEAKEKVTFTRYVGLQAVLAPFTDLIMEYDNGSVERFKVKDIDGKYVFIKKGISKINKFVLEDKENRMICKIDNTDLGTFENVTDDNPTCYINKSKVYIHTINGEKLELNSSEKIRYSGEYKFEYIKE